MTKKNIKSLKKIIEKKDRKIALELERIGNLKFRQRQFEVKINSDDIMKMKNERCDLFCDYIQEGGDIWELSNSEILNSPQRELRSRENIIRKLNKQEE